MALSGSCERKLQGLLFLEEMRYYKKIDNQQENWTR
nr:MAG TPA_asm: hypothetical protein [Caudoviricetes sp.]DAN94035.1 MAG TPA: hypothetical protein [Bacteriophage sp.]DAW90627.1 MAG TPA: hypothetical protein [Bacteriophage sp.]